MSKATEDALGALHGAVAKVLADQISEKIMVNEDGEEKEIYTASPATLAQAIKFLKDNDVTASVEEDDNLSELADQLRKKREKRGLRLVSEEAV